jgi:hypothetical protein
MIKLQLFDYEGQEHICTVMGPVPRVGEKISMPSSNSLEFAQYEVVSVEHNYFVEPDYSENMFECCHVLVKQI